MQLLVDEFMKLEVPPTEVYSPLQNTILYKICDKKDIVLEIFRRKDSTFGFRYQAWVGWRDAGINIRNHSWTEIDSGSNIFTDNLEIVKKEAEANAKSKGVVLTSEWQKSA